MNAVREIEQAEYFYCAARATIFSQAHCAKSWLHRKADDGSMACRACPDIVRETVAGGGADMITATEFAANVRPHPIGKAVDVVPGRLRVGEQDPAERRVIRAGAARKVKIGILLRKAPWLTVGDIGKHLGISRDYARGLLREMMAAGTVERTGGGGRNVWWRYALTGADL